jgi:hypothetical protein
MRLTALGRRTKLPRPRFAELLTVIEHSDTVIRPTIADPRNRPSIVPEREHRRDSRRATRRQITSEKPDRCQHQERSRETEGVRRRHSVEQTSDETSKRQSRAGAENEAKGDHRYALSQHEQQDFSALRAQSHSNPDLETSLADEMGNNPEDADQRQRNRDDPECRQEYSRPPKVLELAQSVFFDGANLGDG